jgi:ubiquitin-conjugating enzyme E2 variant
VRPRAARLIDSLALFSFAALTLRQAREFAAHEWELADILWIAPVSLAAYGLADLVSGLLHWYCDTRPRATNALARILIEPFHEHHFDPAAITRHGFLELTGNSCLALTPLMAWIPENSPLQVALCAATFALFATNHFHRWAHMPDPPRLARPLQRCGLILSPERHARHHSGAHNSAFCVTNGWANLLLDRVLVRG